MKLSIASAILCTVLLASFCNAYPYPVYWDDEEFLEQLQQEERVGTDIEARIEQEAECPPPNTIFDFTNADPSTVRILKDPITDDTLGSEFDYKCQSGFVLFVSKNGGANERASSDLIKYECLRSTGSTFDPSIRENGRPKCFPLCPELPSVLSNGAVRVTGREPGDTASYSCDPGYDLSGPRTRTCSQDGKWSGQESRCVALCPELPSVSNGAVRVTGREPGATASYSCDPGYDLSGAQIRTCGQDGRWSGQEPTCEKECPPPNTIFDFTNADPSTVQVIRDPITDNTLGSQFDYKCQSGFVLFVSKNGGAYERASSDSITYECLRSTGSTFDPSIRANGRPKCFPLCPELPSVSNGAVRVTGREPGATASYSCDPGYDLSGAQTRTCGQDGRWSGQEPTCEKECPPPNTIFDFTNANPSIVRIVKDPITDDTLGSEFDYKCQSGFVLFVSKNGGAYERASSDSITYECLRSAGSTFDPSIRENGRPKCFPICPLPSLPNGEVSHGNREPGDIAEYSCRRGFRLIGPEKRTCGQDGKWSGEEPRCRVITCPLVNPIPNGDTDPDRSPIPVPGGGQGFPLDTVVSYTCRPNFEVQGESTRTCLESGEWDRPEPSCVEAKCPELKPFDLPKNVPEVDRKLKRYRNYQQLRYKKYYNRRIEGDRSVGSKAYLKCVNGWELERGTPAVQTCVSENGALKWTPAGTCVYHYTYPKPKNG